MATESPKIIASAMDISAALKEAMGQLRVAGVPSHNLAAELLLMHTLGRDRAWLYSHPEEPLDPIAAEKFFALIERRMTGEPTQYLTGKQEFWGLDFEVTPAVLIPRPETEHVIEVALERIGPRKRDRALRIADVGTGSGCIAVALAHLLPDAEIFATDISAAALEVARRNAARHNVADRIQFIESHLLYAFLTAWPDSQGAQFDVIVSNPPYVGRGDAMSLPREVRDHEPARALFAGEHGVDMYAPLLDQAAKLLVTGGSVVLELGFGALDRVRPLFDICPGWSHVAVTNDLAGIPRVITAERIRPQNAGNIISPQRESGIT